MKNIEEIRWTTNLLCKGLLEENICDYKFLHMEPKGALNFHPKVKLFLLSLKYSWIISLTTSLGILPQHESCLLCHMTINTSALVLYSFTNSCLSTLIFSHFTRLIEITQVKSTGTHPITPYFGLKKFKWNSGAQDLDITIIDLRHTISGPFLSNRLIVNEK